MERLTYKNETKREMICRYEDCDTCEEYCPNLNEDNCPCLQEVIKKLAEYEDLEEQGKLLKLPCVVGDVVYRPNKFQHRVCEHVIEKIEMDSDGIWAIDTSDNVYSPDDFGKMVFLTQEKADDALKKMKER